MRAPIATAVAVAVGLIVLLGYFISMPILQNIQAVLLGWAVTLAGIATLIGIINLVTTHWRRVGAEHNRDYYSILLILSFLVTVCAGLVLTPADPQFQHVVTSIQVPIEASLMAVLAVSLAYASLRLLQRRKGIMGVVFVISALIFLLTMSGLLASGPENSLLSSVLTALNQLPVAGARGILLGIALGSLATGLRILLGIDRPYSG
jgi:cytochrome bd-type quinol oxidase subunit 2